MECIADFIVVTMGLHARRMPVYKSHRTDDPAAGLVLHGEHALFGKDRGNDPAAFVDALMRRPSGNGTNPDVPGIVEEIFRI